MIHEDPSPAAMANHLSEEVAESLLDLRSSSVSTVLTHGLYHHSISRYLQFYRREQVGVWFTEELKDDAIRALDSVQHFLGIPYFNFSLFSFRNSRGGIGAIYQRSKTTESSYLPMSAAAKSALEAYYRQPNENLARLLRDTRVERYWT